MSLFICLMIMVALLAIRDPDYSNGMKLIVLAQPDVCIASKKVAKQIKKLKSQQADEYPEFLIGLYSPKGNAVESKSQPNPRLS